MTAPVQKQVLINARALIADPAHWTRSVLACTAAGDNIAWYDPSAAKWCAVGAIYRATYDLVGDPREATRIGKKVARSISPIWCCRSLMSINDLRGHKAVLAVFDKALAAA
jgi:hypothetical protein